MTVLLNPLAAGPLVLVAAVGEAEGSWGAAAALACARAEVDSAPLLVDAGGRTPRPTLIASAAAQKLESRLKAQLPDAKAAARGQVCHLAVPAEPDGLALVASAADTAREGGVVLHVPPLLLHTVLAGFEGRVSAVLLRADLRADRSLAALTVRDLIQRGVAAAVLKRRLTWVTERRAMFGVLPSGATGALPERLVRQLTETSR